MTAKSQPGTGEVPIKVPLASLAPDPRNPRKMTDDARAGLGVSMETFGELGMVFNDRTGQMVSGHQRLERLRAAGAVEVVRTGSEGLVLHPKTGERFHVRFVDWDETKQRMANLVANNPHISGDFTEDAVAQLKELEDAEGFAELELGALESELAELSEGGDEAKGGECDPDDVPDGVEPLSKRGDLWLLGNHRMLCGDSTSAEDVARLMDGQRAGLMNTDPPYGIDYSKLKDGIPRSGFKNHQEQWGDIQNDTLTSGPELQEFLEKMIRTAVVHLKDDCAFYFWHPMLTQGTFFAAAAAAADILIHRQIVWKKPGFVLTRSGMYHWQHELCFYGWVRGKPCPWYGEKNQTSVWELGRDSDAGQHPTQKPVELFAIPMRNHTRSGEVVYEPFSGSGSQLIAAEQLGRRCYAMELEPRYVDVAVARWEKFTGRKAARADV